MKRVWLTHTQNLISLYHMQCIAPLCSLSHKHINRDSSVVKVFSPVLCTFKRVPLYSWCDDLSSQTQPFGKLSAATVLSLGEVSRVIRSSVSGLLIYLVRTLLSVQQHESTRNYSFLLVTHLICCCWFIKHAVGLINFDTTLALANCLVGKYEEFKNQ